MNEKFGEFIIRPSTSAILTDDPEEGIRGMNAMKVSWKRPVKFATKASRLVLRRREGIVKALSTPGRILEQSSLTAL